MKKKILTLIITVCMFVLLFDSDSLAYTNVIGKSGASGANIRAEASTSSTIVASVPANTELTICGETTGSDGNKWYLVFVNKNQTGYIRADIITNTGVAAGGETADSVASGTSSGSSSGTTDDIYLDQTGDSTQDNTTQDTTTNTNPVTDTTSSNANTLATLTIGTGSLEPAFSSDVFEYTLTVDETVEKISVYAITTDETSSIADDVSFRDLVVGSNDRSIIVTGQDGTTTTYHFTIIRGTVADEPVVTPSEDAVTEPVVDDTDIQDTTEITGETETEASESKAINLGGYKWIMIVMAFVIVILIMLVVYMAIQMRDMRETITELERERRRRRKKAHTTHQITTDEERQGDRNSISKVAVERNVKPQYAEPKYEESKYVEPKYAEPKFVEPKYEEPQYVEPRYEEPQYEEPQYKYEKNIGSGTQNQRKQAETDEDFEDIQEREATKNDMPPSTIERNTKNKDGWHPVNFLAPEEDMEFEFLDLDDEDK